MSPIPRFTGLPLDAEYDDVKNKLNELTQEMQNLFLSLDSLNVVSLTADHVDTGTLDANLVTVRSDLTGGAYILLDGTGIVINDGTQNTFEADTNGNVTLAGTIRADAGEIGGFTITNLALTATAGAAIQNKSAAGDKVWLDDTGFHSNDASGIERITIGTTPTKGAKALITRDVTGTAQGAYTYDAETVDGASRTGQYVTAHGSYMLLSDDGDVRFQNADATGFRALGINRPEVSVAGSWNNIAIVGDTTDFAGGHAHGITSGVYLKTYDSGGVETGLELYSSESDHQHTIT